MSETLTQPTSTCAPSMPEKRRNPRLPVCWPATFRIAGTAPSATMTTNVSLGGVAFQCKMCQNGGEAAGALPLGCPLHRYSTGSDNPAALTLQLRLPGNTNMTTQVYVVHALGPGGTEGHEVGAAFIEMSCADFDRLSSALATVDTD